MGWEYFARYCNWLHHGMVDEPWAYDDGAYDTTTFYQDPPGAEFPASDLNQDGGIDFFDVSLFIRMYLTGDQRANFRDDCVFNSDDVRVFIGLYEHGL